MAEEDDTVDDADGADAEHTRTVQDMVQDVARVDDQEDTHRLADGALVPHTDFLCPLMTVFSYPVLEAETGVDC